MITVLFLCAATAVSPPADLDTGRVAETRHFELRSGFWINLHDFLYQRAQEPDTAAADPTLAAADAYYGKHIKDRHHRRDPLIYRLRCRLSGLDTSGAPAVPAEDDAAVLEVLEVLEAAAPAYRQRWWPAHDERNRAWIAKVVPRLRAHEDVLAKRLAGFYGDPWPKGRMPVDVVTYASWAGANTIAGPDHVMISSANDGYRDWAALEMIFHEASHTIVGSRIGRVAECLKTASRALDKQPPDNLWHAMLFYTTGEVVRRRLVETGEEQAYEPYVYKRGLFRRAWGRFREPLETHWRPYLDGEIDQQTATDRVVAAVYGVAGEAGGAGTP